MSKTVSGSEVGTTALIGEEAGAQGRYSSAAGMALRYSGSAQGPVISHGFLMKDRRVWRRDFAFDAMAG